MHFYAQPKAMRDKKIGCDVTMLYCTPPENPGYVNLGTCCDQAKACIETAKSFDLSGEPEYAVCVR